MLFSAWIAHLRIRQHIEQGVADTLTSTLQTTHQAISTWAEREQAIVETWSDNLSIRHAAAALLATKREPGSLLASPAQRALREQLLPILMVKGYRGYFIIDRENISLASSRDINVGTRNLLAGERAFLERIWAGYSAISQPVTSDVPLTPETVAGGKAEASISMFAGAPILNNDYEVVAAFVFRIDPYRDFTTILQQGQVGASGETYAFNPQGVMVSLSRFDEQLHALGIVDAGDESVSHRIAIRDPGIRLVGDSAVPVANRPFTRMAQQALQKQNGLDLQGYRDYRGVQVLGAWLWDDKLQMGFATEIDEAEANATEYFVRAVILTFSLTLALLLVALMAIFDRGRRQVSRQSQELRRIIEGSPIAMVLTDTHGNIELFNHRFIELYGWTTADIRTPEEWWQSAYPDPAYRQQVQQDWQQAVTQAQEQHEAITPQYWSLSCKDGSVRDVEFRMVAISENTNVITMIDLTERNRALRIIQYERDRAQSYLDTVDVMIVALDPAGTITEINQAGCALLGYDEDELIGHNWFETCIPPEQRQALRDEIHTPAMQAPDKRVDYLENEVLTRNGERRLIAWRNAPLKDDAGDLVGSLSAGSDITDSRRAELEHEQVLLQLQRVQKAEAIGQLSAGVSHNFNNMFASIIGFLGLAQRKAELMHDTDMQRYLSEALTNSYRARDLVAQIASFSRKSAANKQDLPLEPLLTRSVALLRNILPTAIELQLKVATPLPPVHVDEEQFQQVLANLVSNASEAMQGVGVVEISGCLEQEVTDHLCSSCHQRYAGAYVVLEIRDHGTGMTAQVMERIFDPFYSTGDMTQHTGMGLPVVHGIVHHHGGHIQVTSSPGAGTTVALYLPAVLSTVATTTDLA